ncbi:MAG: questin oxidase family protein [Candidatus Binatus sp.]|uniref:questin oxidase family protein n=1 Tax=Candidatus Binatus sp. TaxID=2811406 RepID=UPI00272460A9|nr:questin oxidase family protein [Candidatus Binatus sp.]MDO8433544.1 questin oxidase family protein [Candidatus Binatus sp.]
MNAPDYSVLDEALEMLSDCGPEFGGGLSNHGPMCAEAMCAMGRRDRVLAWTENYRKQLNPRIAEREKITNANWREALGRFKRAGDWSAFFTNELKERPWHEVVQDWVERLSPGLISAAAHGAIRTGHATRSLAIEDTAQRRRELADALGYWAAVYNTLPGEKRDRGSAMPSAAIDRVEVIPHGERGSGFASLDAALKQLDHFKPFENTLSMVDTDADPSAFVSDLTATFARVFLANAHDLLTAIAFVHAVTGPSAVRPMLPYLRADAVAPALGYAWQASVALYSTFSIAAPLKIEEPSTAISDDELIDRAIATGDEHAIKFTEVCLREDRPHRDPAYRPAALHAIRLLSNG